MGDRAGGSTKSERIPVVPGVLRWARDTAGFSAGVASKRLGVSQGTLEQWESGAIAPTIKQLRKAAKLYKRPLAVLLLPEPPTDFDALRDFRRLPGESTLEWSPELHAEFKRAASQREVFLELDELASASAPENQQLPSLSTDMLPEGASAELRSALGLSSEQSWSNPSDGLNAWITAIEATGIIVIHTRGVDIHEMRGFSISEWPHPVIGLNGNDFPRPRLFTLVHELCHLALNDGGLCDLHEWATNSRTTNDAIEHYCNQVAAGALMPSEMLMEVPGIRDAARGRTWSLDELSDLARPYGVSSESLLLRLIALQRASWDLYWQLKPELEREYEWVRSRQRERQKEQGGGPSYYVVKARDLGHGYVTSVLEAYRTRAISSLDVSDYLDVRFDQLPKLEAVLR